MPRLVWLAPLLAGCELVADLDLNDADAADLPGGTVIAWNQLTMDRVRADAMPPTHASRMYAYTALAGYAAIAGDLDDEALIPALGGLALPEPPDDPDWAAAVAAATGDVAVALAKSEGSAAAFEALRAEQIADRLADGADEQEVADGVAHGEAVAAAILDWAAEDGFADTREVPFDLPDMAGLWVPTPPAFANMHEPWWGTLRPFLVTPADCVAADPAPWSEEPGSEMWAEAEAVWEVSKELDDAQIATALYWADNPGTTPTPPGHWVGIAAGVLAEDDADLETAARVQAVLGVTLADAFIGCWQTKYEECRMRPVTYIATHMDPEWMPIVTTPPFPEYTSGHSVASAAAAEVLTALLGERAFVDTTHAALGEREYGSFREAAAEAAISRLYGGIHYPMGVDSGLEQGVCVGQQALMRTAGH